MVFRIEGLVVRKYPCWGYLLLVDNQFYTVDFR